MQLVELTRAATLSCYSLCDLRMAANQRCSPEEEVGGTREARQGFLKTI